MISKSSADAAEKQKYFLWGIMENTVSGYVMLSPPQDKFLMLYVRGGTGKITLEERSRQVKRGDLFFLRFGLTFLLHASNEPIAFTSFLVSGPCENFPFAYRIEPGARMEQLLKELIAAGLSSYPGAAVPQLKAVFSYLKSFGSPQPPAKRLSSVHIETLKFMLDTRFAEPLHLEQFAEELHLNKYKLIKDFRAYYGLPPIEYLIKRRIQEACRLLQETDKSVTAIGTEVGMDNTPYFIRTFKKKVGCTPLVYRQSLQCLHADKK
jgi:AraC-like DNA-binding protein